MGLIGVQYKTSRLRTPAIEAARFMLCYAVILLHIIDKPQTRWQFFVYAACNAAVPFFFIASGFFNKAGPHSSWVSIATPSIRILALYISWLIAYYIFFIIKSSKPVFHVVDIINGGDAYHLWFLPALALAQLIVGAGYKLGLKRSLLLTCLMLAAISLLSGSIGSIIGRNTLPGTRALAAPLYFLAGKLWARDGRIPTTSNAIIAIIVFWFLSITLHGGLMTYGLGFSVFGLILSLGDNRAISMLGRFGRLSLGIYCIHLIMIWIVMPNAQVGSLPQALAKAAVTLLAATLASFIIASLPGVWRLASYQQLRSADAYRRLRSLMG